jgi:predicted transcriptional regulator
VPQKCVIPAVEEPAIDNNSYTNSKDIVAKAILNYEAMKKYSEKLLSSQDVCK